jgi:hypothetical protein
MPRALKLLLAVTALFTFLIQSGELGTSDTTHRLQVTHSLWTSEPQVFANEYPEFGIHGRGGRLYASYGIGQSLLMLPADLIGSAAVRLPLWGEYAASQADPSIRSIVVSVTTNMLLNVLTALAACQLLLLLGFNLRQAVAGALALMCATTHLHYAQNMTENNYIFLLTLAGFTWQYRWLLRGETRALLWGSAALGLNLLTRITTALDLLCCGAFVLLAILFERRPPRLFLSYLRGALPVYAIFLALERTYQFVRFGSWTTTYVGMLVREQRRLDPSLPADFPFNGHWFQGGLSAGFWGPLFSPQKSIFLFDPLIALTLLLAVLLWRRLEAGVRAFLAACLLLIAAYIAFYAGYYSWGGDAAWGDRFVSSAVELACLPVVPMLLRYRAWLAAPVRWLSVAVIGFSLAVQAASLAFWLPLEMDQGGSLAHPVWVVLLRFKNIAGFALGRWTQWGLNARAIYDDPWDAAHLTTWNFLPALLRHIGVAPLWAVQILDAIWFSAGAALVYTSARLGGALRGDWVAQRDADRRWTHASR